MFHWTDKNIDLFRCSCSVSDLSQIFLRCVSIFPSVVCPTVSFFLSDCSNLFFNQNKNTNNLRALRLGLVFSRSRNSLPGSRACDFVGAVAQRAGHMGSGLKDAEESFQPPTCFNVFQEEHHELRWSKVLPRALILNACFNRLKAQNTGLAVHVMHGAPHERKAALRGVWASVHPTKFIRLTAFTIAKLANVWHAVCMLLSSFGLGLRCNHDAIPLQSPYRYCIKLLASLKAQARWT